MSGPAGPTRRDCCAGRRGRSCQRRTSIARSSCDCSPIPAERGRARRVVEAGIRRAVIAIEDPNPRVSGRGLEHLRSQGVDAVVGVMAEEAGD